MTHYQIVAPGFVAAVTEQGDKIVAATGPLAYWTGLDFQVLRGFAQNKGWRVEPIIESDHPDKFEYNDKIYQFHWTGDTLTRITVTDLEGEKDILFEDLPKVLRNMI